MYIQFQKKVNEVIKKYNTKTAITYMKNNGTDETITFSEIGDFIHNAAQEFKQIGLVGGDRVAIISPHSPYAVFTGMALAYSGITVVLIDAALPREEIGRLLEFSDVRAIFTTSKIYGEFNGIYNYPCFSLEQGLIIVPFYAEKNNCHDISPTKDPEDDVIAILFSSGTTDQMKGIKVTYKSVLKAREVFVRLAGLEDYMKYLLVLPFNHIAGFTGAMSYFMTGCELGFIEGVNPSKLADGLLHFKPHYFAMVPKVYEVMEEKIRAKLHEKGKGVERTINLLLNLSGFLRKKFGINIGRKMFNGITSQVFGENIFGIGTGASPCKKSTAEFYLNLGLEWANLYATTETSVPIVATGVHDRYPADTIGNVNAHPEIQIKIGNPDENGVGEILVKSELMMKGYFRQPELTEAAFENEYFKTGDYGFIDKKGYLHMTGRIKESIVLRTGKKVSPLDVDDYYSSRLPEIELASRGITNEKETYDEIHLFIEDKPYSLAEKENILKKVWEISRQAPNMYKLENIHFIQQIPKTTVGKVKRFSLDIPDRQETKQPNMMTERKTRHNEYSDKKELSTYQKMKQIFLKIGIEVDVQINSVLEQDLGLDSLNVFDLCVEIERVFHLDVSDCISTQMTVGELCQMIEADKNSMKNTMRYNINDFPLKRYRRDKWVVSFIGKLTRLFYSFETLGLENIPKDGPYIICANHESHLDGMWIVIASEGKIDLEQFCCMAKQEHLKHVIFRRGLRIMGGIPVDRSGNTSLAMRKVIECLKNGKIVLIHPEGTRTDNGKLGKLKAGVEKLALETHVRILPVKIEGAYEIFPKDRKLPHILNMNGRYKLSVQFLPPLQPYNGVMMQLSDMIGGKCPPIGQRWI